MSCGNNLWRTGWDSNPRWALTHGGFQDRCLKPLGHLSTGEARYSRAFRRTKDGFAAINRTEAPPGLQKPSRQKGETRDEQRTEVAAGRRPARQDMGRQTIQRPGPGRADGGSQCHRLRHASSGRRAETRCATGPWRRVCNARARRAGHDAALSGPWSLVQTPASARL